MYLSDIEFYFLFRVLINFFFLYFIAQLVLQFGDFLFKFVWLAVPPVNLSFVDRG
jgi:hypothetical protein